MRRYSSFLVILGAALWGTDAVFRRPLTGALSPVTIVFLEHCVLSAVVLPVVVKLRREFRVLRARDYGALLIIACGGSVAASVLFTTAMKYGNPTAVILLQKTQPLFTVILARIILGERATKWFWLWFTSAMAGATMISLPDWHVGRNLVPSLPAASLCALGAAVLWGSSTVCGRLLVARISTPFLTSMRFVLALPALALLYATQPPGMRQMPSGFSAMATIIEMALVPGLLALLLYYKGLRGTTASITSVCELSFPVTAIVVNWLVLQAKLTAMQFFGSTLLIVSVTTLALLNTRTGKEAGSQA